jgi:hypothetical protein
MEVVISPLLVPRFLPATPPSGMDGVIFTSETGVAAAVAAATNAVGLWL